MRNSILIFSFLLITGTILLNCQSSTKKENKTATIDNLIDSIKAQQDTISYQKFIIESENQINKYEKEIADLKTKITKLKANEKSTFEKKLAQLEQKNQELKTTVINYKNEQIDNWDEKQVEFRKDLDELGSAIADFFVTAE